MASRVCRRARRKSISMSAYVETLKQELARNNAAQAAAAAVQANADRKAEATAARERMTSIDVRLARLLQTIPPEVQAGGLSLPELQAMLMGRRRGNAHAGHLGSALRRAGFKRKRMWGSATGQFPARWFPSAAA